MTTHLVGHPSRGTLAAYSLGGLSRAEAVTYLPHLRTCSTCQAYLGELAMVRDKLSVVPASLVLEDPLLAEVATTPEPSCERLAPRSHRAPRKRRRWIPAAAIAAAAVLGAVVVPTLVVLSGSGHERQRSATTISITGLDVSTHITAAMKLRPGPAGGAFDPCSE